MVSSCRQGSCFLLWITCRWSCKMLPSNSHHIYTSYHEVDVNCWGWVSWRQGNTVIICLILSEISFFPAEGNTCIIGTYSCRLGTRLLAMDTVRAVLAYNCPQTTSVSHLSPGCIFSIFGPTVETKKWFRGMFSLWKKKQDWYKQKRTFLSGH